MAGLLVLSWVALLSGVATAVIIAADVIAHPQRMTIMYIVWPVTGLYFPLVGLWLYRNMGLSMTYIKQFGTKASNRTVKQHLAAIRQLFDT
jgi:hypothetical protein